MDPICSQPEERGRIAAETAAALAELGALDGALLPILHRLMERLGRIPAESVPVIARALGLSRAEVHGVVTYYDDFRTGSSPDPVVELCQGEACQARGGEALLRRAQRALDPDGAGRSSAPAARGEVESESTRVRPVYCLGLCATAPAGRLAGVLHARLTAERLDGLIAEARAESEKSAAPSGVAGTGGPISVRPTCALRLFLSADSATRAVGGEAVADAIRSEASARGLALELVRTSTRGLFWLEPLVEVETERGRIGFGPVSPADVASLLDALDADASGRVHPLALGEVEALPGLARQRRSIFRRAGRTRPLAFDDYRAEGGLRGLEAALALEPAAIRRAILESGLRGRGGAAFPAGIKWRTVAESPAEQRFVVCNADEGDSGTYADRMLLEGDPYALIEGMAIAGIAVGATRGFVYVRSEYPDAVATLRAAIAQAEAQGLLGASVLGSAHAFSLEVRVGAGSYVCGEETAMLESLEGRRGIVRAKPPLPAVGGLFGRPTLIQNVLTLAAVPTILAEGADAYRALGVGRSTGTMPFQLAGNVRFGGLFELPFGLTLRTLVFELGGGTASGRPVKAIQVGGPLGCYVPRARWDEPLDYETYAAFGAGIGHGGIVVHDDTSDLARLARHAMAFCVRESCGKCTPCRIGSTRGVELIDRIRLEDEPARKAGHVAVLRDLCTTMIDASLCAMGGMTPLPVLSALDHYPEDFGLGEA
ncbi:MAG: NADH-ubiquinone oxidoreductase-F iron-sulfur binding region domain-containing protein [Myxococcota bacterium]